MLAFALVVASFGPVELDPELVYDHVNPGFETSGSPVPGWGGFPSKQRSASRSIEGSWSLKLDVASPPAFVWNVIQVSAPDPPLRVPPSSNQWGERLAYGLWVSVESVITDGDITMEVTCIDTDTTPATHTTVATKSVNTSGLPLSPSHGSARWIYLSTDPGPAARVLAGTETVQVTIKIAARGVFYIDGLESSRFEYGPYDVFNGDFEEPGSLSGWTKNGDVSVSAPAADFFSNPAYYGKRHLILRKGATPSGGGSGPGYDPTDPTSISGPVTPRIIKALPLGVGRGRPKNGQAVEAGVWLSFQDDYVIGTGDVLLEVLARSYSGELATVATASYQPSVGDITSNRWIYVETEVST